MILDVSRLDAFLRLVLLFQPFLLHLGCLFWRSEQRVWAEAKAPLTLDVLEI